MKDERLFPGFGLASNAPTPVGVKDRADRLLNDISDSQQMIQYEAGQLRELAEAFCNVGNSAIGERLAAIAKHIESHNMDVTWQSLHLHAMVINAEKDRK
jgi:hypothetical protein